MAIRVNMSNNIKNRINNPSDHQEVKIKKRKKTTTAPDQGSRWKSIEKKLKNCKATIAISSGVNIAAIPCLKGVHHIENACPNSSTITDLKAALSAARKTSRFAEIVLKAKADHDSLLASKPKEATNQEYSLQQQEKRYIKKQPAKRRPPPISEELKATVAKRQRIEKEREATRIALEAMKPEAESEFVDNEMIFKELEMLSGCSQTYMLHMQQLPPAEMLFGGLESGQIEDLLQQIGIDMKHEFLVDDYEAASCCY